MKVDRGVVTLFNVKMAGQPHVDRDLGFWTERLCLMQKFWSRSFGSKSGSGWVNVYCDMDTDDCILDGLSELIGRLPNEARIVLVKDQFSLKDELSGLCDSYGLFGGQHTSDPFTHLHVTVLDSDDMVSSSYFDHSVSVAVQNFARNSNESFVVACENRYLFDTDGGKLWKVGNDGVSSSYTLGSCWSLCCPVDSGVRNAGKRIFFGEGSCFCKSSTRFSTKFRHGDWQQKLEGSARLVPANRLSGSFGKAVSDEAVVR